MNFDKFLRYTIPGLVSLLTFFFLFILTDWTNIDEIKKSEITLGEIAGAIVVTGGLGAIFNNIYWAICHFIYFPLDHTHLIGSLKGKLRIIDSRGEIVTKFSKRQAWSIFNTYWYSKTNIRARFEAINSRVDRLSDVTHGLGTTFIGLVLTFVFWFVCLKPDSSWILPFSIGITLILLTFSNYLYSLRMYQALLNTTFASVLKEELEQISSKDKKKTEIEITLLK